jgi:hypothetical protein
MKMWKKNIAFILLIFTLYSCENGPHGIIINTDKPAALDPDYSDIIIPPNIAQLNFKVNEEGTLFFVKFSGVTGTLMEIRSRNGIIDIPARKWKKMLQSHKGQKLNIDIFIRNGKHKWSKYPTVSIEISHEPIDQYLTYRLIYPGYESWNELSIKQRNLENFCERSLIENTLIDGNCVNCHTYNNGRSEDFLFHMRGTLGGTYFYRDGVLKRANLKSKEMKNGAVYPRWHPSGRYVAFSSNKIVQQFHSADNKKVEVTDLESSLVLYDVELNEMSAIIRTDKDRYMDTYPEWSPDGRYLYFCRAGQITDGYDYREIRYNLYRVCFDLVNRKFGEAELVYDAAAKGKSISFPRISPSGKFLVMTLADYGCFPIWHKEADLYSINLDTYVTLKLELNSDYTDSYHSWSSNSKWLVFSSKRSDGVTARPYISYIDEFGNSAKPFILPNNDPEFYQRFLKSYNVPEFSNKRIHISHNKIRKAAKSAATPAEWSNN